MQNTHMKTESGGGLLMTGSRIVDGKLLAVTFQRARSCVVLQVSTGSVLSMNNHYQYFLQSGRECMNELRNKDMLMKHFYQ